MPAVSPEKPSITIGCCTSCLTFLSLPEAVRTIAAAGFRTVEINVSGDGIFPSDMPDRIRDELFTAVLATGLSVNLHIDLEYIRRRARRARRGYDGFFRQMVDPFFSWPDIVPVGAMTFDPLAVPSVPGRIPLISGAWRAYRRMVKPDSGGNAAFASRQTLAALRYAAQRLGERGIRVGLENPARGTCTFDEMEDLRRASGGEWGMLLDVGHAFVSVTDGRIEGRPLGDYIRGVPLEIIDVHVSDNNGRRDQHLFPGEGMIDFAEVFSALRDRGYRGGVMLEADGKKTADIGRKLEKAKGFLERCAAGV